MTAKTFDELWPIPYPNIVIVTGEYGCGKSTFGLSTGAEPKRNCYIDFEKSGEGYAKQMGVGAYHDIQANLTKAYPTGYKMINLLAEAKKITDPIKVGDFDVILLDNASPLEEAFTADVEASPAKYNLTENQVRNSTALKMYAVKTAWMQYLSNLASKAKMVIVIMQLRDKFNGNQPAKNARGEVIREPKGKETLEMVSGLYLWLEHGKGGVPSANVRKSRVDKKVWIADPGAETLPEGVTPEMIASLNGDPGLLTIPVLPLRLPRCTWQEIRWYMAHPANLATPAPGETPTKEQLNDDDRLMLRSHLAEMELALAEQRPKTPVNPAVIPPVKKEPEPVNPAKEKFFLDAAGMGYTKPAEIIEVLKPMGLTPWTEANNDKMLEALKANLEKVMTTGAPVAPLNGA